MRTLIALTMLASTVAGCSTGGAPDAGRREPATPAGSTAAEAPVSPLEGTWTTDLKASAVRAYIREAGWGRAAEKALLDPEMAGPRETEFRIDFVGDQFRMAQATTDEQWQSGVFTLEDGTLTIDDEAPVGVNTFRVDLNGDTVNFDQPGPNGDGFEFMPGVPGWAPAAVLWCSTTWQRTS
ncbi:hypothetical protein [Nocardioides taihuensis]|uniref:DUF1579 domain-containing protein n=1 Tax=Nocardioides taihuensis TaxID=1835606 RepID=A0ABW0BPX8_9ACTN